MDNYECEGYAALAMKEAGVDDATILKVCSNLWSLFDLKTEDEAYRLGREVLEEIKRRIYR